MPNRRPADNEVLDLSTTQRFTVAKFLVLVEGPAKSIAVLLGMLYDDKSIARNEWSVTHGDSSRKQLVARLQSENAKHTRLGVAVQAKGCLEVIQRRAKSLKLECNVVATGQS